MKTTRMLAIAGVATACGAGVAFAAHVPQVDPATVPTGFLAAHNKVDGIRLSSVARAVQHRKANVFVQHVRLAANEATPWHTHIRGPFSSRSSRGRSPSRRNTTASVRG